MTFCLLRAEDCLEEDLSAEERETLRPAAGFSAAGREAPRLTTLLPVLADERPAEDAPLVSDAPFLRVGDKEERVVRPASEIVLPEETEVLTVRSEPARLALLSVLPARLALLSALPARLALLSALAVRPMLLSALPVRPMLLSALPVRAALLSALPARLALLSALPVRLMLLSVRPALLSALPVRLTGLSPLRTRLAVLSPLSERLMLLPELPADREVGVAVFRLIPDDLPALSPGVRRFSVILVQNLFSKRIDLL